MSYSLSSSQDSPERGLNWIIPTAVFIVWQVVAFRVLGSWQQDAALLCVTFAVVLVARSSSSSAKKAPQTSLERIPLEESFQNHRFLEPETHPPEDSGGFFSCCMSRPGKRRSSNSVGLQALDRRHRVPGHFTGLRLEYPGGPLPSDKAFPSGEWLPPEQWCAMLERIQPSEVSACKELLQSIRHIKGPKDPMTMLRYLRARQGDVDKAVEMYRNSMRWREETQWVHGFFNGTIDDDLHVRLSPHWKCIGVLGWDRVGRPVIYERLGQIHLRSLLQIPDEFLAKHHVWGHTRLQQAIDEQMQRQGRPHMYITAVVDLAGLGTQHFDMQGLMKFKKTIRVGSDYFPEILSRVLVVRAPWIFSAFWKIVENFFDPGTREKIQIVSGQETFERMSEIIDPKWIPQELGGTLRAGSGPFCYPLVAPGGPVPQDIIDAIIKRCERPL